MQKIYLKFFITFILTIMLTNVFAANPVSKSYVDKKAAELQKQIDNLGPVGPSDPVKVGDMLGGGIVFYMNNKTRQGLIAATHDSMYEIGDTTGAYKWGPEATLGIDVQGTVYFSGETNFSHVIGLGNNDYHAFLAVLNYQAEPCANEKVSCSEWYLPSIYELLMIYALSDFEDKSPLPNVPELASNVILYNFTVTKYWSSTEYTPATDCAWSINFSDGFIAGELKDNINNHFRVRPVKSFTY